MHIRDSSLLSPPFLSRPPTSPTSVARTDVVAIARDAKPTVSISDAAQRAADAERAGELPLEMYQVPGWYAQYGFELTGELGGGVEAPHGASADRTEYVELIRGHYQAVLDANSIHDVESHYNALIANHGQSESIRRQFAGRVQGDARLLELMGTLGKL